MQIFGAPAGRGLRASQPVPSWPVPKHSHPRLHPLPGWALQQQVLQQPIGLRHCRPGHQLRQHQRLRCWYIQGSLGPVCAGEPVPSRELCQRRDRGVRALPQPSLLLLLHQPCWLLPSGIARMVKRGWYGMVRRTRPHHIVNADCHAASPQLSFLHNHVGARAGGRQLHALLCWGLQGGMLLSWA